MSKTTAKSKAPKAPPPIPPGVNALMSPAQVAAALSCSVGHLWAMVRAYQFPAPHRPEGRDPRWTVSEFNEWVSEHYVREK